MTQPWPEHPDATAYRQAADAFRSGDLVRLRALIDDDVVWHVPGDHAMAGDHLGAEAVLAFLDRLRAIGFTVREHDVFGNDAHVCALSEMGATRPGTEVRTRVVSVFHFRDGRQDRAMALSRRRSRVERHLRGDLSTPLARVAGHHPGYRPDIHLAAASAARYRDRDGGGDPAGRTVTWHRGR